MKKIILFVGMTTLLSLGAAAQDVSNSTLTSVSFVDSADLGKFSGNLKLLHKVEIYAFNSLTSGKDTAACESIGEARVYAENLSGQILALSTDAALFQQVISIRNTARKLMGFCVETTNSLNFLSYGDHQAALNAIQSNFTVEHSVALKLGISEVEPSHI